MDDTKRSRVALILGAGFSAEACQPIMSKFGEFSIKQLYGIKPFDGIIKQQNKNAYYLLKEYGEVYEAFKNYCLRNSKFGMFNANNMEDLFAFAEMLKVCGEKKLLLEIDDIESQKRVKKKVCIDDILHAIYIWLWQIFRRVPLNNPKKWNITKESENAYYSFVQTLYEYGFKNIDIITTNYDILVEFLCNCNGHKVNYPIIDYKGERTICNDDKPSKGNFLVGADERLSPNTLNLYKLHGSVNYFLPIVNNKSKLRLITETGGEVGKSFVKDLFPSISAIDAIYELYEDRHLIPSIVQPSFTKINRSSWLESTWKYSAEALYGADKWIFIGYSFPPSDGHIRSLFNMALVNKNNYPEIIVVSPFYDTIYNYKQIFNEEFVFYKRYFSNFINNHELEICFN